MRLSYTQINNGQTRLNVAMKECAAECETRDARVYELGKATEGQYEVRLDEHCLQVGTVHCGDDY